MINIKKFLEYVVNTVQNIKKSEKIKEEMNSHELCEPYAIFSRLDREDKGFLVKEDFIRFLKENGVIIDPQRKTIDLFIEYYDKNFDEKLNFTEFLNFVLNKNQNLTRSITSQRETYKICCDEYLEKDGFTKLYINTATAKTSIIFNTKKNLSLSNILKKFCFIFSHS